jgi:hypothetical protein
MPFCFFLVICLHLINIKLTIIFFLLCQSRSMVGPFKKKKKKALKKGQTITGVRFS